MFNDMTKKSGSFIIYILFGIIILTFVISFGPASEGGCSPDAGYVANVDGTVVSISEYRFTYNNIFDFYQRIYGSFNREQAQQMGLSGQALDMIVNNILLAKNAEDMGFHVSKSEIVERIKNMEHFQQNGVFDFDLYNKVVQYQLHSTPADYEKKMERELLAQKLRTYLSASVSVSNSEVKDEYLSRNEKLSANFIVFSVDNATDELKKKISEELSEEKTASFMEKNYERIRAHYSDNISDYRKGRQVKARHILIKSGEEEDDSVALEKIREIEKKIEEGADFAEMAKEHSEGPSSAEGGDLGFFEKGKMVPAFDEKVFSMEKGEISEPVKTKFGYHLIKLEDTKEAFDKKLETVDKEIAKKLLTEESIKTLAEAEAEKAVSLLQEEDYNFENFKEDFSSWKIEVGESQELTKGSTYIPGIGIDPELTEKLFSFEEDSGVFPEVLKVDEKFVIARIEDKVHADLEKFEEEKDAIREKLVSMKTQEILNKYTEILREKASIQINRKFLSEFRENI